MRIARDFNQLANTPDTTARVTDNIPTPKDPGTLETIEIEIPNTASTYYVIVRAIDDNNNTGLVSNIVSLSALQDTSWLPTTIPAPPAVTTESPRPVTPAGDDIESLAGLIVAAIIAVVLLVLVIAVFILMNTRRGRDTKRKSRKGRHRNKRNSKSSDRNWSIYSSQSSAGVPYFVKTRDPYIHHFRPVSFQSDKYSYYA